MDDERLAYRLIAVEVHFWRPACQRYYSSLHWVNRNEGFNSASGGYPSEIMSEQMIIYICMTFGVSVQNYKLVCKHITEHSELQAIKNNDTKKEKKLTEITLTRQLWTIE